MVGIEDGTSLIAFVAELDVSLVVVVVIITGADEEFSVYMGGTPAEDDVESELDMPEDEDDDVTPNVEDDVSLTPFTAELDALPTVVAVTNTSVDEESSVYMGGTPMEDDAESELTMPGVEGDDVTANIVLPLLVLPVVSSYGRGAFVLEEALDIGMLIDVVVGALVYRAGPGTLLLAEGAKLEMMPAT
ncbi:hypothetical protein B0A50_04422 [Salinomyces thailandicus]|uniref:Uncharacterized protein n=1 Tax=Salinomyces thailandicus TaxID=706561 RepID=A0A4U0TYI6_9PEZI|nr:hypothetical protein B0A50_04422 [Salinomyces thailandica]